MDQAKLKEKYSRQKEVLMDLYNESMKEIHPVSLVQRLIKLEKNVLTIGSKTFTLAHQETVYVIGSGKASGEMALAIENVLKDKIEDGLVLVKRGFDKKGKRIQFFESDHPTPTQTTYAATLEYLHFLKNIPNDAIVINVISGGTSSILYAPPENVQISDAAKLFDTLLESGATIEEMNIVRKQVSEVHGGRLLNYLKHTRLVDILLSDVPGNDPAVIGSGPTTVDETSIDDVLQVLKKYDLFKKLPESIVDYFYHTHKSRSSTKPLPGSDKLIKHWQFFLGTSTDLASIIAEKAANKKMKVQFSPDAYMGETREMAITMARNAIDELKKLKPQSKTRLHIYHGESYVNVVGKGIGGRNQELALTAALAIEGQHKISILSVGTDGKDGPTDAAGAYVNGLTILRARKKEIEPESYLKKNDSYTFFDKMNDLIKTDAHVTNLMDIQLVLIES